MLEDSITKMHELLCDAGFYIVEQTYKNPISNIWFIEISDRDSSLLNCIGTGTSKTEALNKALSQFCERLASRYFWNGYYLGDEISKNDVVHSSQEKWFRTNVNGSWPECVLNEELHELYNPNGELNASNLVDINSSNVERGICCLPYRCIRNNELVYFPINITDNLYANNGIASGNTKQEAYVQALLDIIKNYIRFKIVSEGISLPLIPENVLDRYSSIRKNTNELEAAGYVVMVHDSSFCGKYPVVSVTIMNPETQGLSSSFGAHLQFEIALQNAFSSLLQEIDLGKPNKFMEAGFDIDEIASPSNLENHFINSNGIVSWNFLKDSADFEFTDWDATTTQTTHDDTFEQLCELIHSEGNDIYIHEYASDKNTKLKQSDFYFCRILVPGMSEIYPEDNLVWENNNSGISVRDQILKPNKTVEECEQLILDLEDLNHDDRHLVTKLIGMPSDNNCIFSDLRVAELITLLALRTQDNERIQEGCEWLIHFKQIDSNRLKTYQCINTILQLDGMTNYATALSKLYNQNILNNALALIDGEDVFPLVSNWKIYNQLIESYKKVIKHDSF